MKAIVVRTIKSANKPDRLVVSDFDHKNVKVPMDRTRHGAAVDFAIQKQNVVTPNLIAAVLPNGEMVYVHAQVGPEHLSNKALNKIVEAQEALREATAAVRALAVVARS